MQIRNKSDGIVEDLVDQVLYCDMRIHSAKLSSDSATLCIFAMGACTRFDNISRKGHPELAIICTVDRMSLEDINNELESFIDKKTSVETFIHSSHTGEHGLVRAVEYHAWHSEEAELKATSKSKFHNLYIDLLEQVGIEISKDF